MFRYLKQTNWGNMKNLLIYLKERFPLPMVGVLAVVTAMFLVAIAQPNSKDLNDHLTTLAIAIGFLFFMLHTRVTDEFKDSKHDNQNYPNRPVQRGVISRRTLVVIGITALTLEIVAVFWAASLQESLSSVLFYGLILGYSVLTAFEFFASSFLDKHFNIYLIVHQATFILYPIWIFNLFGIQMTNTAIPAVVAFILFLLLIEIVRKYELRHNPAGALVMDTYLAVWRGGAFWVIFAICSLAPIALFSYFGSIWLLVISAVAALFLLILRTHNERVRAIAALTFIATGLVIYFS